MLRTQTATEILQVVKTLAPGDYIHVSRKANGKLIKFHCIVEKVEQISTGWMVTYLGGFTPGISSGNIFRDAFKDINPYRDINMVMNIWAIEVVSSGNELPPFQEDYLRPSRYKSRPSLKNNPGYDPMM